MKEYRAKYPRPAGAASRAATRSMPRRRATTATEDHFRNFFDAVRTRRPVVEDAVFGLRAAGPALLANHSYFESRPIGWDAEKMTRTSIESHRLTDESACACAVHCRASMLGCARSPRARSLAARSALNTLTRERTGGRLAPAVRRQDDRRLARLSAADDARRLAGDRRRADPRRPGRRHRHRRRVRRFRADARVEAVAQRQQRRPLPRHRRRRRDVARWRRSIRSSTTPTRNRSSPAQYAGANYDLHPRRAT